MNILIVGSNYKRADHLEIVKGLSSHFNIFFLSFISEKYGPETPPFGQAIFWSDYLSASHLLKKTKPRFVIFFNIENYNEILLNIEAKNKNVKTFIIDHGIRIFENALEGEKNELGETKKFLSKKNQITFTLLKNKIFYFFSYLQLKKDQRDFYKNYKGIRGANSVFRTQLMINDPLRLPNAYISFSRGLYRFWQQADHLKDHQEVHFTGFPVFDKFHNDDIDPDSPIQHALYIDQPFYEFNLLGWTRETKVKLLKELITLCNHHNITITIKLHPAGDNSIYQEIPDNYPFKVLDGNSFLENINNFQVVFGQGSSLDYPLIASPQTVSFSLDLHPKRIERSLTFNLESAGVSESVKNYDDLKDAFYDLGALRKKQQGNKKDFIDTWMFKFDGKSTQRLVNLLIEESK